MAEGLGPNSERKTRPQANKNKGSQYDMANDPNLHLDDDEMIQFQRDILGDKINQQLDDRMAKKKAPSSNISGPTGWRGKLDSSMQHQNDFPAT